MLKKIIHTVLGKSPKTANGTRVEVPLSKHKIDRNLIDPRAIDAVETIQDAGFEAYLVGGAVRDLLLGVIPKDFDIATDATPEEVKNLFHCTRFRAFIIGKRFRIVHVIHGKGREHEVFEVSTFRATVDAQDSTKVKGNEKSRSALEGMKHAVDSSGRVLRDNVWGDIASDAARRDFTINAMYYDPGTEVVVDYHNGIADAKAKVLRMIGDPAARYREDPVRMIRAVRFMAKLSHLKFELDEASKTPISKLKGLLSDVPPSRLFDEMLKLLQTGHSVQSLHALKEFGMTKAIDPLLDVIAKRMNEPMIAGVLADTDARVKADKGVAPSYLLACVLWQDVLAGWTAKTAKKAPTFPALMEAIDEVFDARIGDISGRGKLGSDMREIWGLQPRFEKRMGNSPLTLVSHLRFRAAFDFLCLRAKSGEDTDGSLQELATWWEKFQFADDHARVAMMNEVKLASQAKPKPKRVHKTVQEFEQEQTHAETGDAPKRKRRRRKPSASANPAAPVIPAKAGIH